MIAAFDQLRTVCEEAVVLLTEPQDLVWDLRFCTDDSFNLPQWRQRLGTVFLERPLALITEQRRRPRGLTFVEAF